MTLPEFLAWEERQELRYEFDGLGPRAMTGVTYAHDVISTNLLIALQTRLRGSRCRAHGPNLKIEAAGRIRYPDVVVGCQAPDRSATILPDPMIVFEVVSAGFSRTDRIDKLGDYQATPSIRRYVIVEQDSVGAVAYFRDGATWTVQPVVEGDVLALPEIDVALPLVEIYEGVELSPPPEGDKLR